MASNAAVFLFAGGGRCNKYVAGCYTMLFQLDAICVVHGVVAVILQGECNNYGLLGVNCGTAMLP